MKRSQVAYAVVVIAVLSVAVVLMLNHMGGPRDPLGIRETTDMIRDLR